MTIFALFSFVLVFSVTSIDINKNDAAKGIEIGSAALMIMTKVMNTVRRVDIMSLTGNLFIWKEEKFMKMSYLAHFGEGSWL